MDQDNQNFITISGAREHNLKNITVRIPKNKLVTLSGVSGSGKSSLAMDTLYAEGQRRYVESLSSYARQFLGMMKRPDVDTIQGLAPAIAIDQHGLSHNPRSTVGTVTEIYDYFRVLFARIGHPHCPICGREISRQTSVSITNQSIEIISQSIKTEGNVRFVILSPIVRDKRGEFAQLFKNLLKKGFEEIRVDGQYKKLDADFGLIKTNRHTIDLVVDKLSFGKANWNSTTYQKRLQDDIEIALEHSNGMMILTEIKDAGFTFPTNPKKTRDHLFSQQFACPVDNISLPEIEPRIFSFNSPQGACPECDGLGVKLRIDRNKTSQWRADMLEKQYYSTSSDTVREEIEKLMVKEACRVCNGDRLKAESLSVTVDDKSIATISRLPLLTLYEWTKFLEKTLSTDKEKEIATPLLKEINSRLSFLLAVGVEYLTLDRMAATLSVGEAQRIRLSSQIGTGLTGVLYVLDEPTVGLHQRDTQKLIETLKILRNLGNTVIVVEHDEEVLNQSDWIVDFGPQAGRFGGEVIAQGTPSEIKNNPKSITGQYLSGKKSVKYINGDNQSANSKNNGILRTDLRMTYGEKYLQINGCAEHNLKNINVTFPLGKLICVTGVSGSGKSSLVHDTLYPAIKKIIDPYFQDKPGKYKSIEGTKSINQVLMVDQNPVGRTSRSNPSTYIGVFTDIRELFAETREAHMKGFGPGYFSFNVDGGRCEACSGQGQIKVEMQFLPDILVDCEECKGARFKPEVLEVEYKEKNIAQVLDLTINEALEFFAAFPKIVKKLNVMKEIGLDYLTLGQPSPTLSGGESQRLKLTRELVKGGRGNTVYLMDEPTTGLHFADIEKLLQMLWELVKRGNTVIVIEHNLDIIKNADWLIDLGPEGGEKGGQIVAQGTPQDIANIKESWTGQYLAKINSKS